MTENYFLFWSLINRLITFSLFVYFQINLESYLSSGPDLTIEFMPNPSGTPRSYGPSSAFRLRYEFLDTSLGGAPLTSKASGPKAMPEPAALLQVQSKSCDRVYRFVILFSFRIQ